MGGDPLRVGSDAYEEPDWFTSRYSNVGNKVTDRQYRFATTGKDVEYEPTDRDVAVSLTGLDDFSKELKATVEHYRGEDPTGLKGLFAKEVQGAFVGSGFGNSFEFQEAFQGRKKHDTQLRDAWTRYQDVGRGMWALVVASKTAASEYGDTDGLNAAAIHAIFDPKQETQFDTLRSAHGEFFKNVAGQHNEGYRSAESRFYDDQRRERSGQGESSGGDAAGPESDEPRTAAWPGQSYGEPDPRADTTSGSAEPETAAYPGATAEPDYLPGTTIVKEADDEPGLTPGAVPGAP